LTRAAAPPILVLMLRFKRAANRKARKAKPSNRNRRLRLKTKRAKIH
jgi:hypothetical protein